MIQAKHVIHYRVKANTAAMQKLKKMALLQTIFFM